MAPGMFWKSKGHKKVSFRRFLFANSAFVCFNVLLKLHGNMYSDGTTTLKEGDTNVVAEHLGWPSVGSAGAGPSAQQLGSKQHGSGPEVWLS